MTAIFLERSQRHFPSAGNHGMGNHWAGTYGQGRSNALLWAWALIVVLACHATVAWWLLATSDVPPATTQQLPAIMIDLAPIASPVPTPAKPAPAVLPTPTPPVPTVPAYHPAPHPPTPQVYLPVPPLPQIASEAALAQTVKKPVKQDQKRVAQKPKPLPKPVAAMPVSQPAKPQPATPSAPASTPQTDAAQQQRDAANAMAVTAAKSNWLGVVVQHIAKFKRPPRGRLRIPLRALVNFDIDRSGKLLSHRLLQSSGRDDIDDEALAWIDRAAPLPPPPSEISDADLAHGFSIPFDFMPR
jgi:protein TonB